MYDSNKRKQIKGIIPLLTNDEIDEFGVVIDDNMRRNAFVMDV